MNILFVCTGNTCRSPMAEGLMNKVAGDNGLPVTAVSAGIFAENGAPASEEAIASAQKYDVDIAGHKAQTITERLIEESDVILAMTQGHKQLLMNIAPGKVYTINEYAGLNGDITDPFGGDLIEYEQVCGEIYDAVVDIAEKLADMLLDSEERQ